MRILLAEDERDLNQIIKKKLKSEQYRVDSCFDGREAIDYLKMSAYDVALLDIMMPKKDGYEVLEEIRKSGITTPVIFLTAKDTIDDKVKGLDLGATDYIVKPFSFPELFARIRAATRDVRVATSSIYKAGDLALDAAKHIVTRAGETIPLTGKEYALLELLLSHKNMVLSRTQIMDHLWNFDEGSENAVDVYIRYLRRKIDDPYEEKLIQTVRGAGYVIRDN